MNTFYELSELLNQGKQSSKAYLEFLRVPAMTAGIYVLPAGSSDLQKPHQEDEIYYIIGGRARMTVGSEEREVSQGSLIFVAAEVEHRFYEIAEELMVLVFFAPAETE